MLAQRMMEIDAHVVRKRKRRRRRKGKRRREEGGQQRVSEATARHEDFPFG